MGKKWGPGSGKCLNELGERSPCDRSDVPAEWDAGMSSGKRKWLAWLAASAGTVLAALGLFFLATANAANGFALVGLLFAALAIVVFGKVAEEAE